jgi:creatinine amidohydrolase
MRSRRLDALTWPEVRDAIARDAGAVLPVGATEQHGPHLPICTDALLATDLAEAVAEPCDLLVCPTVSYGYRSRPLSGGGPSFPGTLSLSGRTLMAVVEDVLAELIRHGFRRLVLLSWHYENTNFVYEAAWLAQQHAQATGARIVVHEDPGGPPSPALMELLFEGDFPGWDAEHAAIVETSLMLHLHPEMVLFDRAVDDRSPRHPGYDVVPVPEDFVAPSGTLWKATRASAEKGRLVWDEAVASVIDDLRAELPASAS